MDNREPWIILGDYIDAWGDATKVGLPMADLKVHTSVLGTTGSGKSTFLRHLACQFFGLGGTVIVIEPHGDLILDPKDGILASLPTDQLHRAAVLDFAGPSPPQFNLAGGGLRYGRSVAVDMAMSCIRVMEDSSWEGAVRMREILENTLHVLLAALGAEASMLDMQRFFTDTKFRNQVLNNTDLDVGESRDYWERFLEELEKNQQTTYEEVMQYPLRRIGGFLRNEYLRRILALPELSAKQALNLEKLMNAPEPTMILVPLQETSIGENTKRVLGTLLMKQITNIFMARAEIASSDRQQTLIIIIDEFADLAGGEIGQIVNKLLAQARKFGASVVLATQSLTQLPPDVRLEVQTNTNIKIILRPADLSDARLAWELLGSDLLVPTDFMSIERFCGYARVLVKGAPQPPFYFHTLAPKKMSGGQACPWDGYGPERPENKRAKPQSKLLREIHELAQTDMNSALDRLVQISDEKFQQVVDAQASLSQWIANDLVLTDQITNQVPLARRISRARFGLPWWLTEASYRRQRFSKQKRKS